MRLTNSGASRVVTAFNHGPAIDGIIRLAMPDGAYRVRDLESGASVEVRTENGALVLRRKFAAQDVWAVVVGK